MEGAPGDTGPKKEEKEIRVPHDTLQTHSKYGHNRPRITRVGSNYEPGEVIPANRFIEHRIATAYLSPEKKPQTAEGVRDLTRQLFGELEARGMPTAAEFIVAMKNQIDIDSVFISAADITTDSPMESLEGDALARVAHAFEDLWKRLLQYYRDKDASKEPFLWDLYRHEQYAWGRRTGDTEDTLYLVDVDPHIADSLELLERSVSRLATEMRNLQTSIFANVPGFNVRPLIDEASAYSRELIQRGNL